MPTRLGKSIGHANWSTFLFVCEIFGIYKCPKKKWELDTQESWQESTGMPGTSGMPGNRARNVRRKH
jgi:hypothetical protein